MGRILTLMAALVDELDGAVLDGEPLRVVTDPATISPPCVVVEPPNLTRLTSCADGAIFTVALVATGAAGSALALAQLDALLDAVVDRLDPDTVQPATYLLPPTGEPSPALLLTLERTT